MHRRLAGPDDLRIDANGVTLDRLVAGLFPGRKPGPIAFPDPESVSEVIEKIEYINLETLIQRNSPPAAIRTLPTSSV